MNRSAPSDGYDFGNKRQYRRDVWSEAADFCRHQRSTAQVLLMPSSEGDEIEEAERRGFKRYNMHVVDNNTAIVAHLQRRFPGINTYGVDVLAALRRMIKSGVKLSFANFDFCSHVVGLLHTIKEIGSMNDAFAPQSLVCVNMMRGRERGGFSRAADSVNSDDPGYNWIKMKLSPSAKAKLDTLSRVDRLRLVLLHGFLARQTKTVMLDKSPKIYKSQRVTMMWIGLRRCQNVVVSLEDEFIGGASCHCSVCLDYYSAAGPLSKAEILSMWRTADRYKAQGTTIKDAMASLEKDEQEKARRNLISQRMQ